MAYSTVDQVLTAFPPALTAVGVGSFDVSSAQVSSYYIYTADGVIDSYVSARYQTPVTPTPPVLTKLSCDLCIFDMFRDRNLKVPDFMQSRYDAAIAMLKDIRDGKMQLPGASEVVTGDNFAYSNNLGFHPTFSPVLDELNQRVDSERVQADLDDRSGDWQTEAQSL